MKLSDSGTGGEKEKHRQFDREIKNMISALTRMAADQKPGSSRDEEDDEYGVRIITLSGSNVGATMKSELGDHKLAENDDEDDGEGELDFLSTFVNSNFQAVNNSIMMGSNYETHDPGVHLEISGDQSEKPPVKTHQKAKARKGKAAVRSDHRQSEHTD